VGAQAFRCLVLPFAAILRLGALLIAEDLCLRQQFVRAAAPLSTTSSEQRGSALLDSGKSMVGADGVTRC
jgi:hypothetical protein